MFQSVAQSLVQHSVDAVPSSWLFLLFFFPSSANLWTKGSRVPKAALIFETSLKRIWTVAINCCNLLKSVAGDCLPACGCRLSEEVKCKEMFGRALNDGGNKLFYNFCKCKAINFLLGWSVFFLYFEIFLYHVSNRPSVPSIVYYVDGVTICRNSNTFRFKNV